MYSNHGHEFNTDDGMIRIEPHESDDLTSEKWSYLNRSYEDRDLKYDEWSAIQRVSETK